MTNLGVIDRATPRLTLLVGVLAPFVFGVCSSADARTVVLAWDRNPEPQAVGYRVYVGVETGDYTQELDAGPDPLLAIEGLEDETTYFFAVVAYDAAGTEGPVSTELVSPGGGLQLLSRAQAPQTSGEASSASPSRPDSWLFQRTEIVCCRAEQLASVPGRLKGLATANSGRVYYIDSYGRLMTLGPGTEAHEVPRGLRRSLGGLAVESGLRTQFLTFESAGIDSSNTSTADLVRYRVSDGVLVDRAVLVPDITSALNAESSKIATDPLGRVYAALAGSASEHSRADVWARQILRYDADGRVPAGNNVALSPMFTEGFELPLSLFYRAGQIVSTGLREGKPSWKVLPLPEIRGPELASLPTCAPLIDPANSGIIVLDPGSAVPQRLALRDHYQATDLASVPSRADAFVVAEWNAMLDETVLVRYECVR